MVTPSRYDIEVATAALRTEAGIWAGQAAVLDETSAATAGLGFDRFQAGPFELIVTTHADLAGAVGARCGEGAGEMRAIAGTLNQVADVYDEEERRHVHALRHLY